MGTSAPLDGPVTAGRAAGSWRRAREAGKTWVRGKNRDVEEAEEKARVFGDLSWRALAEAVRADPDAFGVRQTLRQGAGRLIDVVEELRVRGPAALVDLTEFPPERRADAFVAAFIDRVDDGVLPRDAAVREAARACAERILDDPQATRGIQEHPDRPTPISDELFCVLYRFFFGTVIAGTLTTLIGTKVLLAAPLLATLPFHSGTVVAKWVAGQVMKMILSPCQRRDEQESPGKSVTELGRELLGNAVEQALGLDATGEAA
jgi:hypothetical protein